jgi:hypothetical protein
MTAIEMMRCAGKIPLACCLDFKSFSDNSKLPLETIAGQVFELIFELTAGLISELMRLQIISILR